MINSLLDNLKVSSKYKESAFPDHPYNAINKYKFIT